MAAASTVTKEAGTERATCRTAGELAERAGRASRLCQSSSIDEASAKSAECYKDLHADIL